ncbi:phospho-sugar mutase [Albibacterium bauzanense]|uniref:Phosphoglucomutase n=1 Tax=Albibacterium bauzanense TaxID=653929 RepID=A0A4R1LU28_9SPHI|nr:phospho-sugar mutase [Albibacterium bauzanense]TCK80643.1 phosphoglucomutase [Albibacterium bauzanense]
MATIDPQIQQRAQLWLEKPYDAETIEAVQAMINENQIGELTDSFYKDLEFGTGGLRGIMGVGTNRINKYTLGKATQGFSNYLKGLYPGEEIRVVVSYDSRNNSRDFAKIVANVFSGNGLIVYFFDELRPTPELSFAIRELNCHGGVMLTASHNPKEYNGYKAYGRDGGQLVAPHDSNVIGEVNKIADLSDIKFEAKEENIRHLGSEMDDTYIQGIKALSLNPSIVEAQKDLKIVYSSIHGTGITVVPKTLEAWGFRNVHLVEEQAKPDGNFPTVVYPNPEERDAMMLATNKGKELDADVVMATDPDADRVGVAVKDTEGVFQLLNGNQIFSLLAEYVLGSYKDKGQSFKDHYIVKTIVTSNLILEIAKKYGIQCYDVLTGFKFIGELMTLKAGKEEFILGGEESYGFLIGDLVRDKDAVVSCAFIAEMTAYFKNEGKTLFEALLDIYSHYGYFKEKQVSLTKKGKAGAEEITEMMNQFRATPPKYLGGIEIVSIKDYNTSRSLTVSSGLEEVIDLPKSDVLQFITSEGDVISIRPSGTEPKIKFYCNVKLAKGPHINYNESQRILDEKVDLIMKDLI